LGNKVFAGGVGDDDDGTNQCLRHILVVGQQLFGFFGQAVAAEAKAGVVAVAAYARVQAYALDNLLGVKPVGGDLAV
jgi:hypothetical protein